MNASYELKYGETSIPVRFSGAESVEVLLPLQAEPIADLKAALFDCFEHPDGCPPLRELIRPGDPVTLVVSDITRQWMHQEKIIPLVIEYLGSLGIPDPDIAILIATGTHRPCTRDEIAAIVTPELARRIPVFNHSCDAADLVYLGTTSYGTPVRVNPLAVGRKVIGLGATIHHLMSGFSGGRKSFLPGISSRETIIHNHLYSLSPDEPRSNPLIGTGRLAENPLHLDMVEAAALVNPCFYVSLLTDWRGGFYDILCGHWLESWLKSCRRANELYCADIDRRADIVLVSCGGYPKDINLYQGVKALLNAGLAVREGGEIVMLAECREGGGAAEFFGWLNPLKEARLDEALREHFDIPGYIFYAACETIRRCRVTLVTEIGADVLAPMGIRRADKSADFLSGVDFSGRSVIVMPYGGATVPRLRGEI